MSVTVLGVRHHGPGSARSVLEALGQLSPDCILIEGPPDADEMLRLAGDDGLKPPVALLVYDVERPAQASFYPFAVFSPEWQALRFGLERRLPVRFIDLPFAHRPRDQDDLDEESTTQEPGDGTPQGGEPPAGQTPAPVREPFDPIEALAEAAGHSDGEEWWEEFVERRRDPRGLFEGLCEAMAALREGRALEVEEARREAWMRRCIRAAEKEGHERIAVVCGAFHAPALVERPTVKQDDAILKGLPKRRTEATWIPWTFDRLDAFSGYGAGVRSPGWYQHLWERGDRQVDEGWLARAAALLRAEGLDVSSASAIDAVRLAQALAALRGRSAAGLPELMEAIASVLCGADPRPLALVHRKLRVGEVLGQVPEGAPSVPLARDLHAQQRSLRLKVSADEKPLELDLREETDRARSLLLHRLVLLDIPWGRARASSGTGTFREVWALRWQPEFSVAVVEANAFGNTVESAATGKALRVASAAQGLAELTGLLDQAVLADLPQAVPGVVAAIEERVALAGDARPLMVALLPLARLLRYGSVRKTSIDAVAPIVDGIFPRVVVGVHPACASLDDAAAHEMVAALGKVQEALGLLDRAELRAEWSAALSALALREGVHGLVRGACTRALVEEGLLGEEELAKRSRLALSPARPAPDAAAWAQGLLSGSAQLLLHRDGVWSALDAWLRSLPPDVFTELLPLIRRGFAGFQSGDRRAMAEKVKQLDDGAAPSRGAIAPTERDAARAARVLPVLSRILGCSLEPG